MTITDIWLLAIALAMDCMAVSITCGFAQQRIEWKNTIQAALLFGIFQSLMPLLGWLASDWIAQYSMGFDRFLAFLLLLFLGGKMIWNSYKNNQIHHLSLNKIGIMFTMAVATSIDALVVGVSFTCLGMDTLQNILIPICIIGFVAFVLSITGRWAGVKLGARCNWPTERFGGLILILIGIKILFAG